MTPSPSDEDLYDKLPTRTANVLRNADLTVEQAAAVPLGALLRLPGMGSGGIQALAKVLYSRPYSLPTDTKASEPEAALPPEPAPQPQPEDNLANEALVRSVMGTVARRLAEYRQLPNTLLRKKYTYRQLADAEVYVGIVAHVLSGCYGEGEQDARELAGAR